MKDPIRITAMENVLMDAVAGANSRVRDLEHDIVFLYVALATCAGAIVFILIKGT